MKAFNLLIILTLFIQFITIPVLASSQEAKFSQKEVYSAVEAQIEKKAQFTGNVDIYDSQKDSVRHLELIKIFSDFELNDTIYQTKAEFLDVDTKETVYLSVKLQDMSGVLTFKSMSITDIEEAPAVEEKNWTDDEIKEEVKKAIDKKSASSGTLDIYDSNQNKVLNLKYKALKGDIRRFGVLFIVTIQCEDQSAKKTYNVDVTLEKAQDNNLNLKSLRLK